MINIYVLDTEFNIVGLIDSYESFIWTDRYSSYGDFELYTSFDQNVLDLCQQNYYLHINQSYHTMIIEGIEITTDSEEGVKLRITGRSLECLLERRIVWQQTTISAGTKLETAIQYLIEDAIIDPQPYSGTRVSKRRSASQQEISDGRKILRSDGELGFVFKQSEDPNNPGQVDPYIDGFLMEKTQYTGDVLSDVLNSLLESTNNTVGYRITINEQGQFVFQLYSGVDRSYNQSNYVVSMDTQLITGKTYYELVDDEYVVTQDTQRQRNKVYYEWRDILPYVIFSPGFDNIINTDYLDNIADMKNVTLVAGSGEGSSRKTIIVGSETGLQRRELFTDARDLQASDYGSSYAQVLKNRGYNKLVENARVTSYDGQVEATRQFVFGIDFEMGDVIQMSNEYGINGSARVVEWVMSESSSGIEVYPTFDAVQLIDDTETEEEEET